MAKRKGPSTSRPRARAKAAEEGSGARTSEGGGVEAACDQLRCEVLALEGERAKVSEQHRELEDRKRDLEDQKRRLEEQERDLEEQLQSLRLKEEQVQRDLLPKRARLDEAENAKRLDKLPKEVWEKILDELDENDLFPLALSCRYFRQKQKELVARPRQSGPGSGEPRRFALKTTLRKGLDPHKPGPEPTSADYLRFCSKERLPRLPITNYNCLSTSWINWLAAYHGHLPLLQELLAGRKKLNGEVIAAGESSSSQSLLLFVALTSDSFLSSSQRAEANWRPCSG